jgi:hypothetical protein
MEELRRIASRDQFERTDLPASAPRSTDRPRARTHSSECGVRSRGLRVYPTVFKIATAGQALRPQVTPLAHRGRTPKRPLGHSREDAAGICLGE